MNPVISLTYSPKWTKSENVYFCLVPIFWRLLLDTHSSPFSFFAQLGGILQSSMFSSYCILVGPLLLRLEAKCLLYFGLLRLSKVLHFGCYISLAAVLILSQFLGCFEVK
ncbi:hypothetical protein K7X08_009715 [Anisodus acutangulus]|uniref:Uncharacterized protein n=1 Tax=Anisodus acutangulus TaxID=402998 RepID=A0A9Q1N5V5_9SOLA|nr:hypothetical protein K7X08_009715 [Anisodus acutangulus]